MGTVVPLQRSRQAQSKCVFFGSTGVLNPINTGDRRFWPVVVEQVEEAEPEGTPASRYCAQRIEREFGMRNLWSLQVTRRLGRAHVRELINELRCLRAWGL